jgi:hypothetical protein
MVLSLVGLVAYVERVVDTSMFLRTVAHSKTLNGKFDVNLGLSVAYVSWRPYPLQGRTGG